MIYNKLDGRCMNHSIYVLDTGVQIFACIHELHSFVRSDTPKLAATATVTKHRSIFMINCQM